MAKNTGINQGQNVAFTPTKTEATAGAEPLSFGDMEPLQDSEVALSAEEVAIAKREAEAATLLAKSTNVEFQKVEITEPWKPTAVGEMRLGAYLGVEMVRGRQEKQRDGTVGYGRPFSSYHFQMPNVDGAIGKKFCISSSMLDRRMAVFQVDDLCRLAYKGKKLWHPGMQGAAHDWDIERSGAVGSAALSGSLSEAQQSAGHLYAESGWKA